MHGVRSSLGEEREEIVFFTDRETGLRGITVLDDARLGPSVGACRSRPYDEEERALADALRQTRCWTAKALLAGLPIGGGCSVLLSEPNADHVASRSPALGRAIEELGGRYYLAPDLQGDLRSIYVAAAETGFALGLGEEGGVDAVEAAAQGVRIGMETAVRRRLGRETLAGVRVALVGLGTVGFRLAELLRTAGVRLTVADRDPRRTERAVRELGVKCVTVEEIVHLDADVLSPCASKDFIDDGTLCHLRCQIVAGSADDPLKTPAHGHALHDRGILYAPDCVIAAGGLIALAQPFLSAEAAATPLARQLQGIGRRLDALVDQALRENQPIAVIAERVVETAFGARLGAGISSALAG